MLKYLISSKTERDLLVLFFTNIASPFYVRKICRRINQQPNAVRRELKKLEQAGLLVKRQEGNLVYYQIDKTSPVFKELKGLILKSTMITPIFAEQLKKISNIRYAFIYGSYAKGEERGGSDIDVMVIGDTNQEVLNRTFTDIEKKTGREVNYSIMTYEEFLKKKDSGFIINIIKGKKIMLIGDENELRNVIKGK